MQDRLTFLLRVRILLRTHLVRAALLACICPPSHDIIIPGVSAVRLGRERQLRLVLRLRGLRAAGLAKEFAAARSAWEHKPEIILLAVKRGQGERRPGWRESQHPPQRGLRGPHVPQGRLPGRHDGGRGRCEQAGGEGARRETEGGELP